MQHPERRVGIVLLAAGRSERFGGTKLIAEFCGRPLWEWAAAEAESIALAQRVLVVAPASPLADRAGWTRVENHDAAQGMGTSIACGVRALAGCDRAVIALADMPLVTAAHLETLANAQGAVYSQLEDGLPGCPAAFPRRLFPELKSLAADQGARSLGLSDYTLLRPTDMRQLADVDTVRDLDSLTLRNTASTPE